MVANHFETLGLSPAYRVAEAALEQRYRELTRRLHPLRHAAGGAASRRLALEKTIAVNDAWRVLRDPGRRAAYLLGLRGIDLGESGAKNAGKYLPPGFLFEVMEQREAFDDARSRKDADAVQKMAERARRARQETLGSLGEAFDRNDDEEAARQLSVLRYYDRFLGEVRAYEDEAFEERHG
jgi:molecular chaperone HscB